MMCFWQVETKHVQNANDQVKLSGNAQVKSKIEIRKRTSSGVLIHPWGNHEVIIDVTIHDEVDHATQQPL